MMQAIRKFLRDKRGAFAMQFALIVTPLVGCTGLAIDGGRVFLARFELASALDAAALAVGSTIADEETLQALAERYMAANFRMANADAATVQVLPDNDVITLTGRVRVNTYFMPIFGVSTVDVSAESEVRRGGADVEVALALDVTGSMAGTRITALKAAAKDLVNIVVTDSQEPYYSKVAIVPWANTVNPGSYLSQVRADVTPAKVITNATWRDSTSRNITAASWKNGATRSITGINKNSQARVNSSSHGFSNGDFIRITGVSGMTQVNNNIYKVSDVETNRFKLKNPSTDAYINSSSWSTYSSGGTIQKCYSATCQVQVTASSHGLSNGDIVAITGVNGMTQINNSSGGTKSWTVASVTANTFLLVGPNGPSVSDWSSGGTVARCFNAACEIRITSNAHGFANNAHIKITGVNGMTQINNGTTADATWVVSSSTANTFHLNNTYGPVGFSNYTSGGNIWCTNHGCQYLRYTTPNSTVRVREVSSCVTERIGDEAFTDAAPETAKVGFNYPQLSSHGRCFTAGNDLVPLTSSRPDLIAAIDALQTNGYTAGQIGLAWGWYMVSPLWGHLWPDDANRPAAYEAEDLVKVVVLMTDGEYNMAHCNGVVASGQTDVANNQRINCSATNGEPYAQATALCTAIKAQEIVLYTVGFGIGSDASQVAHLQACATEPSYSYIAASNEELQQAFQSIARSITLLRLSR